MTCHVGAGIIICDGRGATEIRHAPCPWCCFPAPDGTLAKPWPFMAITEIHGGYCAPDYICGRCGQSGNYEEDRLRRVPDKERERNIARVRAARAVEREREGKQ